MVTVSIDEKRVTFENENEDGEKVRGRMKLLQLNVDLGFVQYHRTVTRFGLSGWKNSKGEDISWGNVKERIRKAADDVDALVAFFEIEDAEKELAPAKKEEFIFDIIAHGGFHKTISITSTDILSASDKACLQGEVVRLVA